MVYGFPYFHIPGVWLFLRIIFYKTELFLFDEFFSIISNTSEVSRDFFCRVFLCLMSLVVSLTLQRVDFYFLHTRSWLSSEFCSLESQICLQYRQIVYGCKR